MADQTPETPEMLESPEAHETPETSPGSPGEDQKCGQGVTDGNTAVTRTQSSSDVTVVGAVLIQHGECLALRRAPGKHLAGFWEFPGGKVEPGESEPVALVRELDEELGIQTEVGDRVARVTHDYGTKSVQLTTYRCSITGGDLTLRAHDDMRWLAHDELWSVDWAPADYATVDELDRTGI